jgi:hypothetical protein
MTTWNFFFKNRMTTKFHKWPLEEETKYFKNCATIKSCKWPLKKKKKKSYDHFISQMTIFGKKKKSEIFVRPCKVVNDHERK